MTQLTHYQIEAIDPLMKRIGELQMVIDQAPHSVSLFFIENYKDEEAIEAYIARCDKNIEISRRLGKDDTHFVKNREAVLFMMERNKLQAQIREIEKNGTPDSSLTISTTKRGNDEDNSN